MEQTPLKVHSSGRRVTDPRSDRRGQQESHQPHVTVAFSKQDMCCHIEGPPPAWINALIGRIFWDFLREKYWADMVSHKIQKKLSKIRVSGLTYGRVMHFL